jgi:hypothetical protein
MSLPAKDKDVVRDLAKKVAEIASLPVHDRKRDMWTRLNRLERVRPLVHVQAIDDSIWAELVPDDELQAGNPFCREQETALRKTIYCWEHFPDDRVVDDSVVCPIVVLGDSFSTRLGLQVEMERPGMQFGAGHFICTIETERDIEKIQTTPEVSIDWEETEQNYDRLCDLYDGILRVEKRGPDFFWLPVMDWFMQWRGIEQMFVDLVDRPEWVHEALERITTGHLSSAQQIEKLDVLSPGNGNTSLGSGGYAWTDQLPQPDFDGEHVRLKDIWARCATQIFTQGISPEMHDEFAIQYEKRILEHFGLSAYGCCEPLHNKMQFVRQIENLRRVSMSPWVDIDIAAAAVGKDYVYTHKPNPAVVSMERWHPELARSELRNALEKTRENVVEVTLQDLHTVRNEPHRLTEWTEMAMQLAEEYA